VPSDVLEEAPLWLDLSDDPGNVGPQVPGVLLSKPISGTTEGLARIPGVEDMYLSTE